MSLYNSLEFLINNKIKDSDAEKFFDNFIRIENKSKNSFLEDRNLLNQNISIIYNQFNEHLLTMNEKKYDFFTDSEVSEIFDVSVSTVKNWRKEKKLKFEQPDGFNHSVRIGRAALEDFVFRNRKYQRSWNNFLK